MAMTWRQLINAALTTIGNTVPNSTPIPAGNTTITDPYQLQVAEFANQIFEEVWEACQWRAYWTTYNMAYPPGVISQQIIQGLNGNPYLVGAPGSTGTIIINGVTSAPITTVGVQSTDSQAVVNAINALTTQTLPLVSTNVTAYLNSSAAITLTGPVGSTITVAYGAGANVTAAITGLPTGSTLVFAPNSQASVVRMMNPQAGSPVALCFDTTSVGVPFPLAEAPIADLNYMNTITQTQPVQYSTHFAVIDQGGDNVQLNVYPAASTSRNIAITLYDPPSRFNPQMAGTGTGALDSTILLPYRPILIGTIWQALEERGEELGQNSQYTEAKFRQALDDNVSRDTGDAGGLIMIVD